ncbi:exotoxin [Yersinia alsatica]|uniref:exotoxin n=1 Tax=Yersinia alsatica TaxID=2890317 RepID=UPI0011A1CE1A|nr:exotoxin [Yersinia alsatica]HDL8244643.1 exotoxin [Yersinia enterocolitica]HDX9048065.1 exotoxin [Yersinia enterocolitica]HEA9998069.1 exotoxin [Yersinia enterocolitica]
MNRVTAILIAVLIAIFTGLAWLAFHYYGQSVEKDKTITTVTGERNEAQFTLGNYTTTVRLFNDIAKANEHEKNRISNNGEVRAAAIKKDIAGDECAVRLVPTATADLLRKHANQIRSGATGTDTSKLTF